MHRRRVYVFNKILFACTAQLTAYTSTPLRTELIQRSTLDIAEVTESNYNRIVSIKVLWIKIIAPTGYNLAFTRIAPLGLHFKKLILYDFLAKLRIGKYLFVICNLTLKFIIFGMQIFLHQTCKLTQTHVYNSPRLYLIKAKAFHQA